MGHCELCGYEGEKEEIFNAYDLILCTVCYNAYVYEIGQQQRPENQL